MLQITGKCLDVTSETVNGPSGSFVSTTIALLVGKASVERVRVGRDFLPSDLPKEGEDVTLHVVVSAYAGRNGAGYRLTALSRVKGGARIAPLASASA